MGKDARPQKTGSATWLRKRSPVDESPAGDVPAIPDVADFPALTEFLSAVSWPDGSKRVTGSVSLFVDQGRLKAALNDKDQGFVAFVTLDGFEGTFRALEQALAGDGADWRRTQSHRPGKR